MTNETLLLISAESARFIVEQIRKEMCQQPETGHATSAATPVSSPDAVNKRLPDASAIGESDRCVNYPAAEPFGRYMRIMGFDPNDGCVLFLPETLRWKSKPNSIPQYVDFVAFTDDLLLRRIPPKRS
jgi:hypothetical protein